MTHACCKTHESPRQVSGIKALYRHGRSSSELLQQLVLRQPCIIKLTVSNVDHNTLRMISVPTSIDPMSSAKTTNTPSLDYVGDRLDN